MNNEKNNTKLPCMDTCEATLCPVDCHDKAQWFPDEAICHAKTTHKPAWVKIQRKIQRLFLKGGIAGDETCFTRLTLENIRQVRKGIHGIKPEDLYKKGTS